MKKTPHYKHLNTINIPILLKVDGEIYNLTSCGQDFQHQSTSTEIAALKVACVLLEQGKLKQYSEQPYREITVKTPNETVVYEV